MTLRRDMEKKNNLFPWDNYYMDWDESVMGRLMMIPNFYSDSELEYLRNYAIDVGDVDSDIYPNRRMGSFNHFPDSELVSSEDSDVVMMNGVINRKIDWLWSNWKAFSVSLELPNTQYVFDTRDIEKRANNIPAYCNHHMQGSPKNMPHYPIHNDGGKLMTILVPIYPDVNNSTLFHGNNKVDIDGGTMLSWDVNTAYLFRASDYSYHSYVGGDTDRFIMNINFFNNWYKRNELPK